MKCLVIKLNETVQGTGFDYFDALKITFNNEDITKNSIYVEKNTTITTEDGEMYIADADGQNLTSVGTNYTAPYQMNLLCKPNCYYYIRNSSKSSNISTYGIVKTEDFNAFNALAVQCVFDGDLQDVKLNDDIYFLSMIFNNYTKLYGDISYLSKYVKLSYLAFATQYYITGQITSLGTLINLKTIILGDTQISGDLVDFVKEQRKNGRTTCNSITIQFLLTSKNIIFNGQNISDYVDAVNNIHTLSWTETTITLNDVTIDA